MAEFIINQDVKTEEPVVEVTIGDGNTLPRGRHRFRLIVIDDSDNASAPDEVEVMVVDQDAPVAILSAPSIAGFGRSFEMTGANSFDAGGGRIVSFLWTYLGPNL